MIVGGGRVAERKAISMCTAGAHVLVISPTLTPRLEKEKSNGTLRHIGRKFRKGDLSGACMIVAATDDPKVNARIAKDAGATPVNVIDNPGLCTFIVPSVIRRGPLTIAISTSGASPATAKSIRLELEGRFGPEWEAYLADIMKERASAKAKIAEPQKRREHLKSIAKKKQP